MENKISSYLSFTLVFGLFYCVLGMMKWLVKGVSYLDKQSVSIANNLKL